MSKMPELQKKLKDLNKHSEVFKYLNTYIQANDIYKLSGIQQDISTENKKAEQFNTVIEVIQDSKVTDEEKIKLCLLLVLKYSDDKERVNGLLQSMKKRSLNTDHVEKVLSNSKSEITG